MVVVGAGSQAPVVVAVAAMVAEEGKVVVVGGVAVVVIPSVMVASVVAGVDVAPVLCLSVRLTELT